jgi:hypothetical protein
MHSVSEFAHTWLRRNIRGVLALLNYAQIQAAKHDGAQS